MQETEPARLSTFYKLCCWCSGARIYLLKHCPTDYNKYCGIGIIVVFTGIMAAITGAYALFTIFDNIIISIVFGLIWGLLIFSLDWYILASLKKEKKFVKEFLNTLPRIIFAVILGIIISKPLELKLFEKEINQELISMQKDINSDYKNKVFDEYNEIEILLRENEKLFDEIKHKEAYRDSLFKLIIEEAEGRSPTGLIGKGPVYKEKKQEFDRVNNELSQLRERNVSVITQNESKINEIREAREEDIRQGTQTSKNYNGFLAQIQALGSLSEKNTHIKYVNIFIILLFIIIEASPMLVKLMASRGAYDILFELEEEKDTSKNKRQIAEIELANIKTIQAGLENEKKIIQAKNLIQKQQLKEYISAKKQVNSTKINKWKDLLIKTNANQENEISEDKLFSD